MNVVAGKAADHSVATKDRSWSEPDFIALVREFVRDLHPRTGGRADVGLASRIDSDLGVDSLARSELALRIERRFHTYLPISLVSEAETVEDLVRALRQAEPVGPLLRGERSPLPPLPAVGGAAGAKTLVEVLDWHVDRHADRPHVTLLQNDVTVLGTLTYRELRERACAVAGSLIERDLSPGDRVGLMLPTSLEFFVGFFGILYAGGVPVPIYPPARMSQLEEHLRRQAGILRNAEARLLLTVPEGRGLATLLRGQVESLRAIESVADLIGSTERASLTTLSASTDTALIQYTSGSTGDPKGVVLSHANLLANVRAMGRAIEGSSKDIFVSWLPLYHDMGLIGAWMGCLHHAAPLYVMSPMSFLMRPASWLWAIHRYRATLSASPNFGFELCLNKIEDAELQALDLSSLRMVANGSEPVSAKTIRRFADRFGGYGFRADAMAPVYGLAESAVGLAFPPLGRPPKIDRVDRDALTQRGVADMAAPDNAAALELVSCGFPLPEHEIRIVDDAGREVGERRQGRLEFRGPSATSGYFRNEAKTKELIHDGWLDSGDLAYVADGEIHITGRIKDLIIRGGRNIYPQEMEEDISAIPGVRKGGVVAFGSRDPSTGTEELVIIAETREEDRTARAELEARIIEVVTEVLGAPPDKVLLARPRAVPKTSSGKLRRGAARDLFETGRLGAHDRPVRRQLLRLAAAAALPQGRRLGRSISATLYAGWWWTVLGVACGLGWMSIMALPRRSWRWRAVRTLARGVLAATNLRPTVTGAGNIPRQGAVLVFNHASFTDPLLIAAVLKGEPVFVAKKEFATHAMVGPPFRRLGVCFVDRYDTASSIADTKALTDRAKRGDVLVFFPEGTFTRRPGLSEFRLGAFKVAAEASVPVVPGVLTGTRSMLRSGQRFPRRAHLGVQFTEPVGPSGSAAFSSVVRLRDEARAAILARCREPNLTELIALPASAPGA